MKTTQRHRTVYRTLLAALLGVLGMVNTHAQFTFDCGSDGSYGPMNITTNTTLDLPTNGIFNCTTITIASNATLKFRPNALNMPVCLLARGDVIINGEIDVSGALGTAVLGGVGGPGGFAGGNPGGQGLPVGDGHGPGAGRGGDAYNSAPHVGSAGYGLNGNNAIFTTNNGTRYGSPLLIPLIGGSGGGGNFIDGFGGGAGGGGAILLAANTRIDVHGNVVASSPDVNVQGANYGFGSGGAIRLVAPAVGGTGTLRVNGGRNLGVVSFPGGGAGRIRIDCVNRPSSALNLIPSSVATIGANMIAIPANVPKLDITQVGTNNIPVGTSAPVFFMLPKGADTNQNVTVQASNFGRQVPIRVVLTPDNGPSSSYDSQIDNTAGPASVTVPVVAPLNVQVHVSAWTR